MTYRLAKRIGENSEVVGWRLNQRCRCGGGGRRTPKVLVCKRIEQKSFRVFNNFNEIILLCCWVYK